MRNYKDILNQKIGIKKQIKQNIKKSKFDILNMEIHLKKCEKVCIIIQQIAEYTQKEFAKEISVLISKAMNYIFENPYALEIKFNQKYGSTVADIYFNRNEELINPIDSSGGGAVDVACFALRVAFLRLFQKYVNPKTQNVLILDEPLRFLSHTYLPAASALLQELSKLLNIQILMITHLRELAECSSNQIKIRQINGKSFLLSNEGNNYDRRAIKNSSGSNRKSSGRTKRSKI
jgi:DNA repair exonuclease SbcCD ATPase subunit